MGKVCPFCGLLSPVPTIMATNAIRCLLYSFDSPVSTDTIIDRHRNEQAHGGGRTEHLSVKDSVPVHRAVILSPFDLHCPNHSLNELPTFKFKAQSCFSTPENGSLGVLPASQARRAKSSATPRHWHTKGFKMHSRFRWKLMAATKERNQKLR